MERVALVAGLVAVLGGVAAADDAITASVPPSTIGDGKTFVPVSVSGMPKAEGKELPVTDVAIVTCPQGAQLAATPTALPAVLPPFTAKETTIACKAQLRGAEATFKVKVKPPAAGLYASVPVTARSTTPKIEVTAVEWDGKHATPPGALHAAASDGTVEVGENGKLTLGIAGNAPRLVAIVLADGDRLGAAFVPVTGVTTLPVESDPQSNVEVWVSGSWFGPIPTKGKIANVPIEVPPGVTHAVARSTNIKGYVTDAVTDLKIPPRTRIGGLAIISELAPEQHTTLAVAVAGADGRPGAASLKLVASAPHGTVGPAKAQGPGLWTFDYTAPAIAGPEHISIRVDGDNSAGVGDIAVDIAGGAAAKLDVRIGPGPYEPGAELTGTIRVTDAEGNTLSSSLAQAKLGDAAVEIAADGALHGKIPEHLPAGGMLKLVVVAGSVHEDLDIAAGAAAKSAVVHSHPDGRAANVTLDVRDRFGNLAPQSSFEVAVTNGTLGELAHSPTTFRTRVAALGRAREAHVIVRAQGHVLTDEVIEFDPPSDVVFISAYAAGGWMDNLGALQSPRAGGGFGIRRGLGPIQGELSVGAEGIMSTEATTFDAGGTSTNATRTIRGIGIPVLLHLRVPIGRHFGVAVAGGAVPMRLGVKLAVDQQSTMQDAQTIYGYRGQLTGDVVVGPGRFFIGGELGRAHLASANASGQVDGVAIVAGYEWWFVGIGW